MSGSRSGSADAGGGRRAGRRRRTSAAGLDVDQLRPNETARFLAASEADYGARGDGARADRTLFRAFAAAARPASGSRWPVDG
jgi:hypothetical protein